MNNIELEAFNEIEEKAKKEMIKIYMKELREVATNLMDYKEIAPNETNIILEAIKDKKYNNIALSDLFVDLINEVKEYFFNQGVNFERYVKTLEL